MALKAAGIETCGTLRLNRGEPDYIRAKANAPKMYKGEVAAADNGTVCVIYWQDKRCVKMITTMHDDSMGEANVRERGGGIANVAKPYAVLCYNKYMSGVDRVDQMMSYYPTIRRTVKWVKKLFFWYLMLAIQNSHVIHNHKRVATRKSKLTLLEFQMELVDHLCIHLNEALNLVVEEDPMEDNMDEDV